MGFSTVFVALGILGEYIAHFVFDKEARHKKLEMATTIVFGVMVLGGVVGEYLAGDRLSQVARAIQQASDLEVSRLNEEAAEARRMAAELQKTAAELQQTSTVAEASVLMFRARDGDSRAFDSTVELAHNPGIPASVRALAISTVTMIEGDPRYRQQGSGCPPQRPSTYRLLEKLKSNDPRDLGEALGCLDVNMIGYIYPWNVGEERKNPYALSPQAMEEIRQAYPALDILFDMMCHHADLKVRARAFYVFVGLVSAGSPLQKGPMTVLDNGQNARWWQVHRSEYIHR